MRLILFDVRGLSNCPEVIQRIRDICQFEVALTNIFEGFLDIPPANVRVSMPLEISRFHETESGIRQNITIIVYGLDPDVEDQTTAPTIVQLSTPDILRQRVLDLANKYFPDKEPACIISYSDFHPDRM